MGLFGLERELIIFDFIGYFVPPSENVAETKFLIAMIEEAIGHLFWRGSFVRREASVYNAFLDISLRLELGEKGHRGLEGTFGLNQTFWKNPNYGALNFMLQYSYLFRNPWYVASGAPRSTHNNMVFLNLRYTLPGAPPSAKK